MRVSNGHKNRWLDSKAPAAWGAVAYSLYSVSWVQLQHNLRLLGRQRLHNPQPQTFCSLSCILYFSCFAVSLQHLCHYWGLEGALPLPNIYILMTFMYINFAKNLPKFLKNPPIFANLSELYLMIFTFILKNIQRKFEKILRIAN